MHKAALLVVTRYPDADRAAPAQHCARNSMYAGVNRATDPHFGAVQNVMTITWQA